MVAIIPLLLALIPSTTANCYWPNGGVAGNYVTCPNSKVCCLKGEACLSNGFCYAARYNVAYRGACTDTSWPIAECPRACYDTITDQWANLLTCSGTARGNFTCSKAVDGKTACEQNVETWMWEGDSGVNVTAAQDGLSSTSSTASSSATSSSPSATLASLSSANTSASAAEKSSSGTSSSSAIALGAGLGAGLGVPLVLAMALLVYFCIRMRRRSCVTSHIQDTNWTANGHYLGPVITTREAPREPFELVGSKHDRDRSELHG
ncbi:uncharacterized protein N7482_008946 [Penicillium canariense]|uniref:Mid2 domain-containing protein n=1 Tax=Penicillium canariense TaxID=189055 RepID=A0A9W9HUP9_9EURO|nr:uncharacterized protein N7482_008946 [Penicillium canariense]KAJ5157846.1 hypothetical protein N7482_008946 [Penicillium canariense]